MSFSIYFLDSKKYLCYIKYSTNYFVWKNLLLQKHKFGLCFVQLNESNQKYLSGSAIHQSPFSTNTYILDTQHECYITLIT